MNNEQEIYKIIRSFMPFSLDQHNGLNTCDCEILSFGETKIAFSMDSFSSEDGFRDEDGEHLGSLMATAAISDLLAAGADPVFYAHSIGAGPGWDKKYMARLCRGIAGVLSTAGMNLVGGDYGETERWTYTACVFGNIVTTPLYRNTASVGDLLFVSGKIGRGNMEAALSKKKSRLFPRNNFPLRLNESRLIRHYATGCIDTSDGLLSSVNILAEVNGCGFVLTDLAPIDAGKVLSSLTGFPPEFLAFCEAGEYELLFSLSPEKRKDFLEEAKKQKLHFFEIGRLTADPSEKKYKDINLGSVCLRARDYAYTDDYLKALSMAWKRAREAGE